MPPNNLNFNSLTRKNRVELMKTQPVSSKGTLKRQFGNRNLTVSRQFENGNLSVSRKLSRQFGNRNLTRSIMKPKLRFSNNTKNYNQNTRGKVFRKSLEIPYELSHHTENELKNHSNNILALVNNSPVSFNNMKPGDQAFIESLSRVSGPMSTNYRRPYYKGVYGPKNAKIMANLSAKYNSPFQMLNAVDRLPISQQMKSLFKQNIRSQFNI